MCDEVKAKIMTSKLIIMRRKLKITRKTVENTFSKWININIFSRNLNNHLRILSFDFYCTVN